MRLKINKSKNAASFYMIKDIVKNGKRSTKIVEKLGTLEELIKKLDGKDPIEWANEYIKLATDNLKSDNIDIIIKKSNYKQIEKDLQNSFNGGYLFLEKIYYRLGLNKICTDISRKYKFEYDLNNILSRLIFARIIYPSSKLSTSKLCKKFVEQPNFELNHIYRALDVIAKEKDFIQAELYNNSLKSFKRNDKILYYDCTNYFFETEEEEGSKQYGKSKENRPNPIVQMGLFMDGDGVPLAFDITSGNTNEQVTLRPLEEKILEDFKLSKFIVCTDAGLASNANRKFNDKNNRSFITTQSIKKLKKHLMEWALDKDGWGTTGEDKIYNINTIEQNEEKYINTIFYKERWINENNLEQKLIVTFSLKYKNYQNKIRNSQIERANVIILKNPTKLNKVNANDYRRFVKKIVVTKDGEIAENTSFSINEDIILKEKKFDGFYGVCTNLEESTETIIKINQRRWEIEECFRIMKSEFKARPAYVKRDNRIVAHFTTCFLALVVYRFLEKILGEKYTTSQIIDCLREMNFSQELGEGYQPTYTRTDLTDDLHEKFEFRTDYEINTNRQIKEILKNIKQ